MLLQISSACLLNFGNGKMKRLVSVKNIYNSFKTNYSRKTTRKWPRQVFSAIQPTGEVHLGNYLGVIRKWVDYQNSEENPVIFAIADLHSITLPKDPDELQYNIYTMAATLLACGIDTNKTIFFQQSAVPQHSELCWLLGTMTTMPKLARLPQYKEKCELDKDLPVGIFMYPVLQAADIMLYRSTHIPVGEDQVQQIELAHHLIRFFNNKYTETFPIPEIVIDSAAGKIKSLVDSNKKMSKSDSVPRSCINLLDDPDEIRKKCRRALSDFTSEVTHEPERRPAVNNLITIYSGITRQCPKEIVAEFEGLTVEDFKGKLADVIISHLNPIRKKIYEYLKAPEFLVAELKKGSEKVQERAEKTIKEVKDKMGFDLTNIKTILTKRINKDIRVKEKQRQ